MQEQSFPDGFWWGASTAAHQVEGNNHNQWSEWELKNADRLAHESVKEFDKLPSWEFIKGQARRPATYLSGKGVEHYTRYKQDFGLLKQLNMNAFRFGIEWSRIEPEEGVWNEAAINHYRHYIETLHEMGIQLFPTLWHWTMPVWFTQKGGFERRRNIKYFERFVAKVMNEYGTLFTHVLTLNEPNVYVGFSYIDNRWPPQRHNLLVGIRVYVHLMMAHRRAFRIIKRIAPTVQVGLAMHIVDFQPAHPRSLPDKLGQQIMMYRMEWSFLDHLRRELDFIGVNYYFTQYVDWRLRHLTPHTPLSDVGWYMEPRGIERALTAVTRRYHKPIVITENGVADRRDVYRQWWLEETIAGMHGALKQGVDLRGYLHWSLLDNFEWAEGWWPAFGLTSVDRQTMKRTLRPSAQWFAHRILQEMNAA